MDEYEAYLESICQRLFAKSAEFYTHSALLLDRLDAITELLALREIEITRQEVTQIIDRGLAKIKKLSAHFRELILDTPYHHPEYKLLQKLLQKQNQLTEICNFPYVIAYEWVTYFYNPRSHLTEEHRGDLVLMDEAQKFAVVELKYIYKDEHWANGERLLRTRHARRQAKKFERFFQHRFPWAEVESFALTNAGLYYGKKKKILQPLRSIFAEVKDEGDPQRMVAQDGGSQVNVEVIR